MGARRKRVTGSSTQAISKIVERAAKSVNVAIEPHSGRDREIEFENRPCLDENLAARKASRRKTFVRVYLDFEIFIG